MTVRNAVIVNNQQDMRNVTAQLSTADHAAFEEAARKLGTSKGALARKLILQFLESKGPKT